jgi:hypothetical protein
VEDEQQSNGSAEVDLASLSDHDGGSGRGSAAALWSPDAFRAVYGCSGVGSMRMVVFDCEIGMTVLALAREIATVAGSQR